MLYPFLVSPLENPNQIKEIKSVNWSNRDSTNNDEKDKNSVANTHFEIYKVSQKGIKNLFVWLSTNSS